MRVLVKLPFYLLVVVATALVSQHPFFWDTVQFASKHATYFYTTDFQSIILPEALDSGHPPCFGMYMATVWKIFGRNLVASHWAMLPFLLGIVYFAFRLAEKTAGERLAPWLVAVLVADPVLAGQSVLVSPDLVLACSFLMGWWAIWGQRQIMLMGAVVVLGLISTRGMMVGLGLFAFSLFCDRAPFTLRRFWVKLWPFLPGGLLTGGYLFYHWQQTGWIGYHAGSTWSPSFQQVDFQGFLKNIAVLAWRMLDFGRVFVWAVLLYSIYRLFPKIALQKPLVNRQGTGWQLVFLFAVMALVLIPTQLPYRGLLAHRYLLPVFIPISFLACFAVLKWLGNKAVKYVKIAYFFLAMVLAAGNCWVYPKGVSQGWDSTLAHLPWYGLMAQAEAEISRRAIGFQEVGTAFPNIGPRDNFYLNRVGEGFGEKDLADNCYILFSNVMNDFTDEEIRALEQVWEPVFTRSARGVYLILYKNKSLAKCGN